MMFDVTTPPPLQYMMLDVIWMMENMCDVLCMMFDVIPHG